MNHFFLLFLVLWGLSIRAQTPHATCNATRYLTEEFTEVDTTTAVLFGVNTTYQGVTDSLYMDIYQPVGDTASQRPMIIWAFGGSFVLGQRSDMAPLCHYYAQRGYVAATIDYRLYDGPFIPFPDSTVFADVVMKAIGDMKAAVRYFREDAAGNNAYKIDSNLIFVGGGSAGAIMALHTAYLDSTDTIAPHIAQAIQQNGGFEGNTSSNTAHSSAVRAVLNLSGALGDAAWIDQGDVPVFSVHDDNDNIVPYGQGYGTIVNIPVAYLEGSQVITDTATSLGIPNVLITIPNSSGHVSYVNDPLWQDSVFNSSLLFLHDIICPVIAAQSSVVEQVNSVVYPNPAVHSLNIDIPNLATAYDLTITNAIGTVVYQQQQIDQSHWALPRQNLAAGVYYIQIKFHNPELKTLSHKVLFR